VPFCSRAGPGIYKENRWRNAVRLYYAKRFFPIDNIIEGIKKDMKKDEEKLNRLSTHFSLFHQCRMKK
jgi:hypothetical protein